MADPIAEQGTECGGRSQEVLDKGAVSGWKESILEQDRMAGINPGCEQTKGKNRIEIESLPDSGKPHFIRGIERANFFLGVRINFDNRQIFPDQFRLIVTKGSSLMRPRFGDAPGDCDADGFRPSEADGSGDSGQLDFTGWAALILKERPCRLHSFTGNRMASLLRKGSG